MCHRCSITAMICPFRGRFVVVVVVVGGRPGAGVVGFVGATAAAAAASCVGATAQAIASTVVVAVIGAFQGKGFTGFFARGRSRVRLACLSGGWCTAYLMLLPVASNVVHGVHTPGSMAVTVGNVDCCCFGADIVR